MKTDQEVIASRDDLEMMRRPHLWPRAQTTVYRENDTGKFAMILKLHLRRPRLFGRTALASLAFLWQEDITWPVSGTPPDSVLTLSTEDNNLRRGGDEMLVQLVSKGWIVSNDQYPTEMPPRMVMGNEWEGLEYRSQMSPPMQSEP